MDSIKKVNPPKPDIQCEVKGRGPLAFELVEIISYNVANNYSKQMETKKRIIEYHAGLPDKIRVEFDALYSNAMIFPKFDDECTLRQRQKLFPLIIEHLLTLNDQFEGETFKDTPKYRDKLRSIKVKRHHFKSPVFDLPAGGLFGNIAPFVIDSKFQKKYKTEYPIHLLAYIELNPMPPEDLLIWSIKEYVEASMTFCQFQKIWIFNSKNRKIIFEYPLDMSS